MKYIIEDGVEIPAKRICVHSKMRTPKHSFVTDLQPTQSVQFETKKELVSALQSCRTYAKKTGSWAKFLGRKISDFKYRLWRIE